MKYLFLTLMHNRLKEDIYIENSYSPLQMASNTFEYNLIKGFIINKTNLDVMNFLPVGTFPTKYKKILLKTNEWRIENVVCKEYGGPNICVVKQIYREKIIYHSIKKWIEDTCEEKCIIVYSIYLPFLKALQKIKKKYADIHLSIIITDLPGKFGVKSYNLFKNYLLNFYGSLSLKYINQFNSFVLLTEEMKNPLKIQDRSFIVIEGICSSDIDFEESEKKNSLFNYDIKKEIIFYSGTLNYQFGIVTLLDAFQKIRRDDVELWICGGGEAAKYIKKTSQNDNRIKYYGFCSKEKVKELMENATILINPRNNSGEYTKYSFPSKTMEYLISGIPVLMYKLDGIPDEYDKYLYYIKGEGIDSMKESIESCLSIPLHKRKIQGELAKKFVIENKSEKVQAFKIKNMIENQSSPK